MLIYLAPVLLVCPLFFLFRNKENGERIILFIVSGYVFLLLALRSVYSGVDLPGYQEMFGYIGGHSFQEVIKSFSLIHTFPGYSLEWGYSFLNWLFVKVGLNFRVFLIFQSLFCVGSACFFIDRNSIRPALSVALLIGFGFVDYTFCILRQAMGLALLLFAATFLKNKKIIPTLIFSLLAIMMHRSSAVFLIAIPLSFIPINKKTVLGYCLLSLIIIPSFPFLYNKVLEPVFQIFTKTGYLAETNFELKEMLVGVFAIALFLIFFSDEENLKDGKNNVFFWTFMISLPLEAVGLYIPILSRVTTLTILPFASVAIPNLVETNKNKKLVIAVEILIYLAAIGYYILCLKADKRLLNIIPYNFFFVG